MVLPKATRTTRKRSPSMPRKRVGIKLFAKKNPMKPAMRPTATKTNTNSNSGPGKLKGQARALARVKNATARAAISKSPGKTFPAGKLAAQAAKNIRSMVKKGGGTTTRVRSTMPKKAVATQKRASSVLGRHR